MSGGPAQKKPRTRRQRDETTIGHLGAGLVEVWFSLQARPSLPQTRKSSSFSSSVMASKAFCFEDEKEEEEEEENKTEVHGRRHFYGLTGATSATRPPPQGP